MEGRRRDGGEKDSSNYSNGVDKVAHLPGGNSSCI